ncbi:MAG: hypothetical protein IPK75_03365 [Acidobacteria bacterium]|jgi:hypothetical protein|nr:hypothetical protein [Acidobacteriota bacterium]
MQTKGRIQLAGVALAMLGLVGCGQSGPAPAEEAVETAAVEAPAPFEPGEADFKCIRDMHPVRGFYVDNLLGNLEGTIAAAESETGAVYPAGSVVQLVPGEAMIKREAGFNPATKDWEFFELDVTEAGGAIRVRGADTVVNQFGGNCLSCHEKAKPEFDLICEQTHGCDPIPLTPVMVKAIQNTDPRCPPVENLPPEQLEALAILQAFRDAAAESATP